MYVGVWPMVKVVLEGQKDSVARAEIKVYDGDILVSTVTVGIRHGNFNKSHDDSRSFYPIIDLVKTDNQ